MTRAPNKMFLGNFVILQVVLFAGYFYELVLNPPKDSDVLWGSVPKQDQSSLLWMAGVAYVLNIAFVLYFYETGDPEECAQLMFALSIYYTLQLAFIPLLKLVAMGRFPPWVVTGFLFLCVVPFIQVAKVGWSRSQELWGEARRFEAFLLTILTFVPAGHVIWNDAISFGLKYPC